jgi:hypothetical protein
MSRDRHRRRPFSAEASTLHQAELSHVSSHRDSLDGPRRHCRIQEDHQSGLTMRLHLGAAERGHGSDASSAQGELQPTRMTTVAGAGTTCRFDYSVDGGPAIFSDARTGSCARPPAPSISPPEERNRGRHGNKMAKTSRRTRSLHTSPSIPASPGDMTSCDGQRVSGAPVGHPSDRWDFPKIPGRGLDRWAQIAGYLDRLTVAQRPYSPVAALPTHGVLRVRVQPASHSSGRS